MAPRREPVAEPVEPVEAVAVAQPVPAAPAPVLTGPPDPAGLCFGAPIHEGGRTLVPVARVRADPVRGDLEATPLGVFDVGGGSARFRAVSERGPVSRAVVQTAAAAFAAAAGATLGAGALRRRRPAGRLSPRRSRRR
jgi:hypothetical protein